MPADFLVVASPAVAHRSSAAAQAVAVEALKVAAPAAARSREGELQAVVEVHLRCCTRHGGITPAKTPYKTLFCNALFVK